MNGVEDHIHMLVDIHPSVALAEMVKDVKQWSNHWLKQNPHFPHFYSWGEGYYAVSVGISEIEQCRNYIINQEQHHHGKDLMAEMEWMALTCGLTWYADDWA